jgi:hypothetical protein
VSTEHHTANDNGTSADTRVTAEHAQLAELRRQRLAVAEARAKRNADREFADALAREQRALAEEIALADAEAEHGPIDVKIGVVETDLGIVILKRAHANFYKRFQDQGRFKTADVEKLVRPSVVYPDADAFDRILDELPATLVACGNKLAALAGQRAEDLTGK